MNFSSLPALGQPLEAGIFAGLTTNPDGTHCAVVLLADKPQEKSGWKAAMDWATKLDAELPNRSVAAMLFANVGDQFEKDWHWTGEEFEGSYAWVQGFGGGCQFNYNKSFKARARAVRLIQLTS